MGDQVVREQRRRTVSLPDVSNSPVGMRILAAIISFVALAGIAAACVVFAMMMVLFSADGKSAGEVSDVLFHRTALIVIVSLVVAVAVPPLLMLFRFSATQSVIPAALGFTSAGIATFWYVLVNLGASS